MRRTREAGCGGRNGWRQQVYRISLIPPSFAPTSFFLGEIRRRRYWKGEKKGGIPEKWKGRGGILKEVFSPSPPLLWPPLQPTHTTFASEPRKESFQEEIDKSGEKAVAGCEKPTQKGGEGEKRKATHSCIGKRVLGGPAPPPRNWISFSRSSFH